MQQCHEGWHRDTEPDRDCDPRDQAGTALGLTVEGSTWFDGYRCSFDAVWETATPIGELEREQRQSLAG
jgi:hypothetical protein